MCWRFPGTVSYKYRIYYLVTLSPPTPMLKHPLQFDDATLLRSVQHLRCLPRRYRIRVSSHGGR